MMMDGQEIINIINNVSSLSKAFGCILALDDVQRILADVNTTGHGFLQWANGMFLQQQQNDKEDNVNIRTFPIGFILNTGTHQNGGKHWQSIYFDDEVISYFFDSYGRVAPKIFKRFEVMIRGMYHHFDHYNHNVQMCAGSTACFPLQNFIKCAKSFEMRLYIFRDNSYDFKTPEEKNKAGFAFSEMIYKRNDSKISLIFHKLFGYKDPNIFL